MTIDTGSSVAIARPDIVAGQSKRRLGRACVLPMTSGETIPVIEALVELTLGWQALRIWVFFAEIMDEYNMELDVLWDYDASVDLEPHLLRQGQVEVTIWRTGTQPKSSRISLVRNEVILARCEVVMARLEAHLGGSQHSHGT